MNTIHTTRSYNGFLTAVSQILRRRFFILWHFHNFINTFWINDYELNFVILAFFSTTFNCPIETFKWAVPNFIKIEPNQRLYHRPICNCTAKKLQGSTKRTRKLLKNMLLRFPVFNFWSVSSGKCQFLKWITILYIRSHIRKYVHSCYVIMLSFKLTVLSRHIQWWLEWAILWL